MLWLFYSCFDLFPCILFLLSILCKAQVKTLLSLLLAIIRAETISRSTEIPAFDADLLFQLLRCEDFVLYSVLYHYKLNIFEFSDS